MARRALRGSIRLLLSTAICVPVAASLSPAFAAPPAPHGHSEWWFDAWHVQEVWRQTTGAGVTIAVLDTGVAAELPDLQGHVVAGVDLSGGSPDGRQDIDPKSHGTVMASLLVGQGRATGMLGVAPGAKVMPIVVGVDGPSLPPDYTARAIRYAVDHGAQVVNMSYVDDGRPYPDGCPPEVLDAVRYAVDQDVVLIAGAGNDGDAENRIDYPAACPGVLAVGAVDEHAQPWVKTSRHDYVDVAAPGVDTVGFDRLGRIVVGDGTSGAAALTSGAVALLRARYPQLSARQIVARLLATLRDKPPGGRKDLARGYGTIRLLSAVTADVPADAPNPVFDELKDVTPSATPVPGGGGGSGSAGAKASSDNGSSAAEYVAVGVGAGFVLLVLVLVLVSRRRRRPVWADGTPGPYGFGPPGPPGPVPPGAPPGPPSGSAYGRPPTADPGWPAGRSSPVPPPQPTQGGYIPPMQPPPPPGVPPDVL